MKREISDKRKKYIVLSSVFIVITFFCVFEVDILSANTTSDVFKKLSDIFLIPSAMYVGVSLLSWIAAKGQFDMLSFAFMKYGIHNIVPFFREKAPKETFYEYKVKKEEERKEWLREMFHVGLAGMFLCIVFTILYYIFS